MELVAFRGYLVSKLNGCDGEKSSPCEFLSGVAQGIVLGHSSG